jgi:PAS domain S-box-containing protein
MGARRIPARLLEKIRSVKRTARDLRAHPRSKDVVLSELEDSVKRSKYAVLVTDRHSRYVAANPAAVVLTGYTRGELLKLGVWSLAPEPEERDVEALWRGFLDSGEQYGAFKLRRKSGRVLVTRYVASTNVLPGIHVSVLERMPPSQVPMTRRKPAAVTRRAKR